MSAQNLAYFKFVSLLIDSGIWAIMSPAARALYPVLLRFSDGNFKPVYPGGNTLLKLTGFKQKSTLRKARTELVDLGLISITTGTGRKNTLYHFRFDTLGVAQSPLSMADAALPGSHSAASPGMTGAYPGGSAETSPYNKIHISINNNVRTETDEKSIDNNTASKTALRKRFGDREFELAVSECKFSGLPDTHENLEKILYRSQTSRGTSWAQIENNLSGKISSGSLDMIKNSFIGEKNGAIFISDSLPEYLKELLRREYPGILFEPLHNISERQQFWQETGKFL